MFKKTDKDQIHEDDEEMNILYDIQTYYDSNQNFNTKFIDSIEKVLDRTKHISGCQYNILVDIYYELQKKMKKYNEF